MTIQLVADMEIEYPNDFLEVALNELLNEFKEKDKSADWNDMQNFVKKIVIKYNCNSRLLEWVKLRWLSLGR